MWRIPKWKLSNFRRELVLFVAYPFFAIINHAVKMIVKNGGVEKDDSYILPYQTPQTAPLEIGFEGIYRLVDRKSVV